MLYLGQYDLVITGGSVDFPENFNIPKDFKWYILHLTDNEPDIAVISADTDMYTEVNSAKIISQGRFSLNADNTWSIPKAILDYLNDDMITFIGMGNHVEIWSHNFFHNKYMNTSEINGAIINSLDEFLF